MEKAGLIRLGPGNFQRLSGRCNGVKIPKGWSQALLDEREAEVKFWDSSPPSFPYV